MESSEHTNQLLQCLIHTISRISIPPEKVYEIVGPGKKQIKAFNLCDGTNSQMDIAKKTKINQGNLSRTLNLWLQNGVVFRIGEGTKARWLHVYPISEKIADKKK